VHPCYNHTHLPIRTVFSSYFPCIFLYVSIISPLALLYSSVGSSIFFNLLRTRLYSILESFVALRWTFSMALMSFFFPRDPHRLGIINVGYYHCLEQSYKHHTVFINTLLVSITHKLQKLCHHFLLM
jgi:hypothetical protein